MRHDEFHNLESLKADIAARLRKACAHLSDGEFGDLVDQMARVELKYARRAPTDSLQTES